VRPATGIGERSAQDELAELVHQSGRFRHAREDSRRNVAADGWRQRSKASTPTMTPLSAFTIG